MRAWLKLRPENRHRTKHKRLPKRLVNNFTPTDGHHRQVRIGTDLPIIDSYFDPPITESGSGDSSRFMKKIDYKSLKKQVSFRSLLESDGHKCERAGHRYRLCCPFHNDSTPSFYIHEDDTGGYCFGCGWSGDSLDYLKKSQGLPFKKAVKLLQGLPRRTLIASDLSALKAKKEPQELTEWQREQMKLASEKLTGSINHCEGIAACREWEPQTIQRLAEEGALGIHRGALAFIYNTGLKVRDWPHRRFEWEFGKGELWRVGSIKDTTKRVFLCEGETDAITLVDIEMDRDGDTAIVALPSATTFPSNLTEILKGKEVILCMDADEAGKKAEEKLRALLSPVCPHLKTINLPKA